MYLTVAKWSKEFLFKYGLSCMTRAISEHTAQNLSCWKVVSIDCAKKAVLLCIRATIMCLPMTRYHMIGTV